LLPNNAGPSPQIDWRQITRALSDIRTKGLCEGVPVAKLDSVEQLISMLQHGEMQIDGQRGFFGMVKDILGTDSPAVYAALQKWESDTACGQTGADAAMGGQAGADAAAGGRAGADAAAGGRAGADTGADTGNVVYHEQQVHTTY
jgi:hypothetical protein